MMENDNQKVKYFKFAEVQVPKVIEKKFNNEEIVMWGATNKYPIELINYYNTCSLHNRLINTRVTNIEGTSIIYNDEELAEKTDLFLKSINFKELFHDMCMNYQIFGGFALNLIYSKDGKSIVNFPNINFYDVRSGIKDENGVVNEYFTSPDWFKSKKEITSHPSIDINNLSNSKGSDGILYSYQKTPGLEYYPIPYYHSALNEIETLIKISEFNLNTIDKGFFPMFLINSPDPMNEVAQENFYKKASELSGKVGGILAMLYPDQDHKTEITPLDSPDLPSKMIELKKQTSENLYVVNQIHPALAVATPGQLSQSSELQTAFEMFNYTVVNNQKGFILDKINKILEYNKLSTIEIKNSVPVKSSIDLILDDLTSDERRELYGFKSLEVDGINNKKLLSERLGIGGTDGVIKIIIDTTLSKTQKILLLNTLYGFSKSKAEKIILDTNEQQTSNQLPEN